MNCTTAWCRQHHSTEFAAALTQPNSICIAGHGSWHNREALVKPGPALYAQCWAVQLAPRATAMPRHPSQCSQLTGVGLET